jgi:hypothetical protein
VHNGRARNFHKTGSPLYAGNGGYVAVCCKCVAEIYERERDRRGSARQAMRKVCLILDVYYSAKLFDSIEAKGGSPMQMYLRQVNMAQYKGRSFEDTLDEEALAAAERELEAERIAESLKADLAGLESALDEAKADCAELEAERDSLEAERDSLALVLGLEDAGGRVESREWMGTYTPRELEYLDSYYAGLQRDYKIATENHKDYARKIAKASLHMDLCYQAVKDRGDKDSIDAYAKARDTFDSLCKSAKFSEQSRNSNDSPLGCYGATAELVERREWVPRHVPVAKDDVDKLIDDFRTIELSL